MPVRETLTAVLQARESITSALGDVESGALDAAAAFEAAQAAADALEGGLDAVERGGEAAAESLRDVTSSAASAAAGLSLADERADEAGDSFIGTATEAGVLAGALSSLPAAGALGGTVGFAAGGVDAPDVSADARTVPFRAELDESSFAAVHAAIDAIPRSRTLTVEADLDTAELAAAQSAMTAIPDGGVVDVGLDAPGRVPQPALPSMPDVSALSFGAEVAADVEGGDELAGLGAAGHLAAEGLDAATQSALESSTAAALAASSADETGDAMTAGAAEAGLFAGGLGTVRDAAFAAIPGLTAAEQSIDETGDEATVAAGKIGVLTGALAGLGGVGLGAEFGGIHGGLGTIAILAGTLLPIILALGAAFGGLAIAFGAVASVIGAGIFGGLLASGENLIGTTQMVGGELERVTTAAEGVEAIMADLKSQASAALEPLKGPLFQDLALDTLEGGVRLLGDFAEFAAATYRELQPVVDAVSAAFWDNEPAFFDALHNAAVTLAPILADLMIYLLENLPAAMNFLTGEAAGLSPELAEISDALIEIIPPLARLGATILSVALPAIAGILSVLTPAVEWFNALPGPVKELAVTFALVAGAALLVIGPIMSIVSAGSALIGAISSVIGFLGGLSGILSAVSTAVVGFAAIVGWPITILLALAAAIGTVITYMGWWDDIIAGLQKTFNLLVEGVVLGINNLLGSIELMVNSFLTGIRLMADAVSLIPGIDIDTSGLQNIDIPKLDAEGLKTDVTGKLGGMSTGQGKRAAKDGKRGRGGGGQDRARQRAEIQATRREQRATAKQAGPRAKRVYNQTVEYHDHGESQNEARQKRIVRGIVSQMNEERRKGQSGLN